MAVVAADLAFDRRGPRPLRGLLIVVLCLLVLVAAFALWLRAAEADHMSLSLEGMHSGHVSRALVVKAVSPYLNSGFFGVDMRDIQRSAEALPWVAKATVHRHWPGTVSVKITPHKAVARWGKHSLVGADGKVFTPPHVKQFAMLPGLSGPQGSQGKLIAMFQKMQVVLQPAGVQLAALRITPRGTWRAHLHSGLGLRLGRNEVMQRLKRFAGPVVNALGSQLDHAAYVDLRYNNGFAVGWKQKQEDGS